VYDLPSASPHAFDVPLTGKYDAGTNPVRISAVSPDGRSLFGLSLDGMFEINVETSDVRLVHPPRDLELDVYDPRIPAGERFLTTTTSRRTLLRNLDSGEWIAQLPKAGRLILSGDARRGVIVNTVWSMVPGPKDELFFFDLSTIRIVDAPARGARSDGIGGGVVAHRWLERVWGDGSIGRCDPDVLRRMRRLVARVTVSPQYPGRWTIGTPVP
jgi:hypothetical protein